MKTSINWFDKRTKEHYCISDLEMGDTFIYHGDVCMKCLDDDDCVYIILLETGRIRYDFDCAEFIDELVNLDITIKDV